MFLKNRNISSKIKRSKVTDYAALISCLSLATTNIDCFLTKKFVKTKKFEKGHIMGGFRQLFFFLHGFPILGIFDS